MQLVDVYYKWQMRLDPLYPWKDINLPHNNFYTFEDALKFAEEYNFSFKNKEIYRLLRLVVEVVDVD